MVVDLNFSALCINVEIPKIDSDFRSPNVYFWMQVPNFVISKKFADKIMAVTCKVDFICVTTFATATASLVVLKFL